MIIVTGASRGLGHAITERLIERGEEVIGFQHKRIENKRFECDKTMTSKECFKRSKVM